MHSSRDLEEQAAKWLVRLDLDHSPEVRAEFQKWLSSGPKNHATYLRLEKSWRRADYLKNVKPLDGEINEDVLDTFPGALPPEVRRARARSKQSLPRAIAACVAFAALLGILWAVFVRSEWQAFKTDLGGFQRIALQDGSVALLNTNSELRVRLTEQRREIELTRGEALFDVAHDPSRPFDVRAGDTLVRAVGTAFSVRLREQREVDILVKEGRVALAPPEDSLNTGLSRSVPLPQISIFTAGEAVRVSAAHKLDVQKINDEDIDRRLAWTRGRLSFDRVTLTEAIAEFNRYNRRQLVIDDPNIAQLRIGGVFDTNELDSFVAALGTFGIKAVPLQSNANEPGADVIHLSSSTPP